MRLAGMYRWSAAEAVQESEAEAVQEPVQEQGKGCGEGSAPGLPPPERGSRAARGSRLGSPASPHGIPPGNSCRRPPEGQGEPGASGFHSPTPGQGPPSKRAKRGAPVPKAALAESPRRVPRPSVQSVRKAVPEAQDRPKAPTRAAGKACEAWGPSCARPNNSLSVWKANSTSLQFSKTKKPACPAWGCGLWGPVSTTSSPPCWSGAGYPVETPPPSVRHADVQEAEMAQLGAATRSRRSGTRSVGVLFPRASPSRKGSRWGDRAAPGGSRGGGP
eukprot:jgi/Botrbrau1/22348/Bobra.0002s0026.1